MTQDNEEPSAASAGSVASIDAQELMCELHHIAGSEQHDPDVRRTACEAESAIARLIHWVNELQMNVAERQALAWAADAYHGPKPYHIRNTIRGFLERTK